MGYEYHLYKMKKVDVERLRDMPYDVAVERFGEETFFYAGHLPMENLHSNGDLVSDELLVITEDAIPLFRDKSFENTEESMLLLLTRKNVQSWIECYQKRVINYYEKLVEKDHDAREKHVRGVLDEWKWKESFTLEDTHMSHSALYEYAIFQLLFHMKTLKEDEFFIFTGH